MSNTHPKRLANLSSESPLKTSMCDISGNPAMFWAMAYKVSDVLMTLTEKGIIKSLSQTPATIDELASTYAWKSEPLKIFLELLVATRVLDYSEGRYSLPSTTQAVLPIIKMEFQVRGWHRLNRSLENVLETGKGAKPLTQIKDEDFLGNYLGAMDASSRALALHIYRYSNLPSEGLIVDIGGADGALARHLSTLMPRTRYCVIDRAPVRKHFDAQAGESQPGERISFVDDDITAPKKLGRKIAQAQAVIVSNVLHLLSDSEICELMCFLRVNLPQKARIVLYDQFLAETKFSASDLMMIDWAYLGTKFNMTDNFMTNFLADHGMVNIVGRRFPLLPGALICASTP